MPGRHQPAMAEKVKQAHYGALFNMTAIRSKSCKLNASLPLADQRAHQAVNLWRMPASSIDDAGIQAYATKAS